MVKIMEETNSRKIIEEKLKEFTPEQMEQVVANLNMFAKTISSIELPQPKFSEKDINEMTQSLKAVSKAYSEMDLVSIVEKIAKSFHNNTTPKGIDIPKYCKLRKIKMQELSDAIGVSKTTMSRYVSGEIDMPASKALQVAEYLNVSLDLLFKRKNREMTLGYIGKEFYLHEYDYKKKEYVPTPMTYALDKNLEPLKDKNLIIIRYKKPIYELNLPNDAILFITEGSDAIDLGTTKKIAVCIKDDFDDEFYTYIEPLQSESSDKDYSSVINYTYKKDGKTITVRLSKLKEMVKFVIHKAVIDF